VNLTPSSKTNQSRQYVWGILLVVVVSLVSHYGRRWISEDNLMLYYLVSVIVAALYWGVGPAMLVSVLSFLALDFGVFQPRFRLNSPDLQYFLSLITFLGVGYVISKLSNRLRSQAQEADQRAKVSLELQQLGRDLTQVHTQGDVVKAFEEHAGRLFGGNVRLLLGGDSLCRVGGELPEEHAELLFSFCQQAQLALQRVDSENELRQAMLVAERERVQNALLNSLSHDLQTPLASVAGSLQVATDPSLVLEPEVRQGLLQLAGEQTERLRRLVSNLLQMTRLDGPGLVLNRQSVEVDELIGVVLEQGPRTLRDRITTRLEDDLPELDVDYVLVVNLLLNLLENAHKYTPQGTPVEMHVARDQNMVRFDVRDRGPGIPLADIPRIFDKFYRAEGLELSGSGLGLFIAKGIVDAHQGKIEARLREGGGLEISCWLPCAPT
jgi:two-component system sensor histidine kinase KdpD